MASQTIAVLLGAALGLLAIKYIVKPLLRWMDRNL